MAPATPSHPVARRFALALVLLSGASAAPLAAPRPAVADSVATERYRDKNWKFSLLTFREWEQVPLVTKGSEPTDLFDDCLVARFAERQGGRAPGLLRIFRMVNGSAGGRPAITGESPAKPASPPIPPSVPPIPPAPTPPAPGAPPAPPSSSRGGAGEARPKNMVELIEGYLAQRMQLESRLLAKGEKDIRSKDGVPGRLWLVDAPRAAFFAIAIFEKDGTEVGLLFGADGATKKKFEAPFVTGCRSFRWFDDRAEDADGLPQLDGLKISPRKRREIETGLVEGWDVVVSPKKNYVVVYDTKGRTNTPLAKMIAERIEQIRAQVYEVQFPPSGPIDAVSVVRLCGGAAQYRHYGGPPGSAGYWNDDSEELVFYDASPKREADDDTLAVLYHEAFHQYIYYSVGKVAPHSWFNEGHGDYYAGARYTEKKFVIRPFAWRVPVVKAALQAGPCDFDVVSRRGEMVRKWDRSSRGYSPLSQLVEMDQGEYYAYPSVSYAQGWSLVYFLREVVPKNPAWNAKWGKILTTYFDTLKSEVKRIEAEEAAAAEASKAKAGGDGTGMGGGNPAPGTPTTPTPTPGAPTPGAPTLPPSSPAPPRDPG